MESPIKSPLEKLGRKPTYTPNPKIQQSIEFSRYKQDCRKRALDLAAGEYAEWYRIRSNPRALIPTGQGEVPPNITELADKYYNWLINLPQ